MMETHSRTGLALKIAVRRTRNKRLWVAIFVAAVISTPRVVRALVEALRRVWRPNVRKNFIGDAVKSSRFADLGSVIPSWLLVGLQRGGFDHMKEIQRKAIPIALEGLNVAARAPTGSGKTLAFLVPGLTHAAGQPGALRPRDGPLMLALAPTRELAVQISNVVQQLTTPSRGAINSLVVYGGIRKSDQLSALRLNQSTHVIIATPGRLLDLVRMEAFNLRRVSFFVLDEGDRMLDQGFEPDVTTISKLIRPDRQMLFFSATWPSEVGAVASKMCSKTFETVFCESPPNESGTGDSVIELPGHSGLTLPPREIKQKIMVVSGRSDSYARGVRGQTFEQKLGMLFGCLQAPLETEGGKAIVFVSTRDNADQLGRAVSEKFGLRRCGIMHGQKTQDNRENTLKAFRQGHIRVVIATDVLGRGVDIDDVSHVVNFDSPWEIETYVHRVGRTGRNGKAGTAITLFEHFYWNQSFADQLAAVLQSCGQAVPCELILDSDKF